MVMDGNLIEEGLSWEMIVSNASFHVTLWWSSYVINSCQCNLLVLFEVETHGNEQRRMS